MNFDFVVKRNDSYLATNSDNEITWTVHRNRAWQYASLVAFSDAEKYIGSKVYIVTNAREIEIFKSDFIDE